MNKLITVILSLTALTATTQAQAVTVSIAGIDRITLLQQSDTVVHSDDDFATVTSTAFGYVPSSDPLYDYSSSPINAPSTIKEVLVDDNLDASAGISSMATYVVAAESQSYIEITFGDSVKGSEDLIFFFTGGVVDLTPGDLTDDQYDVTINFDLDINTGSLINITDIFIPNLPNSPGESVVDVLGGEYTLTAAIIDLSAYGYASEDALNTFRIYLGNDTYPSLSGVGYITAIPLPLPIVLFASGLGVLGLFGHRKNR